MSTPKPKDKPFAIPKSLVWEAYRRVAANKGAPGVDGQALEEFEADLAGNLYKVWKSYTQKLWMRVKRKAAYLPGCGRPKPVMAGRKARHVRCSQALRRGGQRRGSVHAR